MNPAVSSVAIRLLGAVEVIVDDLPVTIGSRIQRSLLAMLALEANRVVGSDRLLDGAWRGDSGGSRSALHVHISHLRTLLEPDRRPNGPATVLRSVGNGYMLTIDARRIDVHELSRLVAEGLTLRDNDPVAAVAILRRAEDMFNGSPLLDLEDQNFALPVITRLTEIRLEAISARIDAELELERYPGLPAELAELVASHPTRETFVRQQMLALAGTGRHPEALRAYARYRSYLADELGLEPSPVLQALEASILSHEPVAGRRPEGGEGPSGPGAVLAMEVIAARKLWLERTSRMHHAYSALHQLVTGTVGRLGGSVTGDSGERITVAFDEPGAAIQAAVACQIATRSADFYVDLTVRAAVAGRAGAGQGAAAEQVVERCCQLAAYAPPGAVLVSDELVGAVGAAGFEVSGYGTIRSHGHLQRSRLHLVVADGLDAAGTLLPVAESLSLPRPVTTLVGRDRELSLVKRLVDEHHLVSIVGPAGVGKTALAIEVAWTVARDLDDGAFFVDLSPARPDSVASIVAAALGIRADDDSALTATLGAVAGRQMLLVLDNCEHVTDAVAELAGHCESLGVDLRMLATTRRAIDAGSERVYALRPLAVRQLGTTGQLAPAVQLFFDRAHQSGCELSEDELTVDRVARICDQLDGLPLAVELTAARLRSTSLRGIEEQLSTAGPLVTASSGNRQERDLERTIAWSYDLLPERERSTFSHLGVFHGSFGIDAAASVAGRSPESVVSMLRHLADWSLVMPVDNERETRYRTLETLRAFAASRLGGQGPSDNALRRHADYFRELARAGERELCGPHEARWVARFVDDFENLIGAFEWYVGTGEADDAIDLAGSLWSFALQRTEGARFFAAVESALSSPAMAGSARRSELLGIAANGAWLRGDPLTACDLAIASITAEDEPTRSAGSGRALIPARMALLNAVGSGFGSRDFRPQVHAEAAAAFDSMQEICHRAGDPYWLVFPYVLASFARSFVGDYGSAQSAASSAVEHAIVSGSVTALSWALLARASALHPADTRPAVDACERSLREASEIGSQFPAALAVSQLAILRRRAGDHATAAAHLVDGLERWHRLGNAPHAWHAIREACLLADAMGRTELIGPLLDALGAQSLVFPHDETDMRAARSLAKAAAPPRPGRAPETLDLRAALDLARTDLGQVRGVPAVG